MTMIEVKDLKKSFGPKQVLRGVSASVADGEVLSIIGGSGSGKSTFIKCVMRLISPDSGSIIVHGKETIRYQSEYELIESLTRTIPSMSSSLPMAYPTRSPARLWDLERVRMTSRFGCSWIRETAGSQPKAT